MKMNKKASIVLIFLALISTYAVFTLSLPAAPGINYISNTTSQNAGIGFLRDADDGGYITTINLDIAQQNLRWKAYVGNVTGKFVLEDGDGYSIYEWDMSLNTEGKVFISRNNTVQWATVNCTNRTNIYTEEAALGMTSADSDSINSTFSATIHKSFLVAGRQIVNSTCPSIATYINDTNQTMTESAKFQELLLADSNGNIVYTTVMEQDELGYRNDSNYDFQAIIADDETAVKTPYYFYVELGI